MRLDKYLKVARLIKRRTVANEACDNGLVTVNGKSSYGIAVGILVSHIFRGVGAKVFERTALDDGEEALLMTIER